MKKSRKRVKRREDDEPVGGKLMPSVDGPSKCSVARCVCRYLDQAEQVPASRRDICDAHRECRREDQVEQAMNNVLRGF